jgi:hypothetical protein
VLGKVGPDHRIHEDVDRDVVDPLQLGLEALASRAVGIGEDREDALAAAAPDLHRLIERQGCEIDRRELAQVFLGQVAARGELEDISLDDVPRACIGVEDLQALGGAEAHLVESGNRRRRHCLDGCAAELRLEGLADRRLVRPHAARQQAKRENGCARSQETPTAASARSRSQD